jgi:DNA-binding NarL/FixJ family response regulator
MSHQASHAVRVLLLDDEPIVRAGLSLLLRHQRKAFLISEAQSHTHALSQIATETPDIILLNFKREDESFLEALPTLLKAASQAAAIVLLGAKDAHFGQRAMALGAMGLVQRNQSPQVLFEAIDHVLAGHVWCDCAVLSSLLQHQTSINNQNGKANLQSPKHISLTERERQLVALVGDGLNTAQIARQLFIAESTVRNHIASIFRKLGVSDRLGLAVYAHRHNLLPAHSAAASHHD